MYIKLIKENLEYDERKNLELLGINLNDEFLVYNNNDNGDITILIDEMQWNFCKCEYQVTK